MTKTTGVIYGRFSNAAKEDKVVTLESQFVDERRRAKADGCAIVEEFADDGFSAYNPKKRRPGWDAMLDYVREHHVDRIYTRESDRTTRQQNETGVLLAFCAENRVTLVEGGSVTGPDDPDAQDMRRMKAMFDERFSRSIQSKVRKARAASALAGRPHGGIRPFGYNKDRRTLHPIEGPAYQELFQRVIDGAGVTRIAHEWEAKGILNSKGARFDAKTIRTFVHAPRAIGRRVHQGEDVGAGDWEPIVTKAVQDRAKAAMAGRRRLRVTGPHRAPRLLSSLMVCAECDQTMRSRHTPTGARYVCEKSKSRCCGKATINAEPVERQVELWFLARLRDPKTLRDIKKRASKAPDLTDLSDELERLQADLDGYTQDARVPVSEGGITRSELQVLRKGLVPQIEDARAALEAAQSKTGVTMFTPAYVLRRWANADLDERRRFLGAYLDNVIVQSALGRGEPRGVVDLKRIKPYWF